MVHGRFSKFRVPIILSDLSSNEQAFPILSPFFFTFWISQSASPQLRGRIPPAPTVVRPPRASTSCWRRRWGRPTPRSGHRCRRRACGCGFLNGVQWFLTVLIYIHTCIYIYINIVYKSAYNTYIHIQIYTYTIIYTHIYTIIYNHMQSYALICNHMQSYAIICIHTYMHISISISICISISTVYLYLYLYIYIYIYLSIYIYINVYYTYLFTTFQDILIVSNLMSRLLICQILFAGLWWLVIVYESI